MKPSLFFALVSCCGIKWLVNQNYGANESLAERACQQYPFDTV
jgi:hypothetical protein